MIPGDHFCSNQGTIWSLWIDETIPSKQVNYFFCTFVEELTNTVKILTAPLSIIYTTKKLFETDDYGYDGNYINSIIDLTDSEYVIPIMGFVLDG